MRYKKKRRNKIAQRRPNERAFKRSKEATQNPKKKEKEKERGSNTAILFTTLVLVAPTFHYREFSCCFISITMWGINDIELGLYILRMSLLK